MSAYQAQWATLPDGRYAPLRLVNLSIVKVTGIYVIYCATPNGTRAVRVGQGDVADRVTKHRVDKAIMAYEQYGTLYVTWAAIPGHIRGGVEKYLSDLYQPLIGERFPDVLPVAVNLP